MKPRDLELLSAYLDGQLTPSDSARLETRLKTDRELASVMDDLRTARGYLRQLPLRRAPRTFTLTRKMVGQNPPLPRAYPAFRIATALATLLFFLSYGLNFLAPQFGARQAYGMGGGGSVETYSAEAPVPAPTEAPVVPQLSAPVPTVTEEQDRLLETPSTKNGVSPTQDLYAQEPPQLPARVPATPPLISIVWQYILLGIAILGGVFMLIMRQLSSRRWK
jgi:anti-sigma factor RsiW